MKLYLAQHGEAKSKQQDPDRPLTDQGLADIIALSEFLLRRHVKVKRAIHSGKLRARQTTEQLARNIAPGIALEVSDVINPNDDPAVLASQIQGWHEDILIVGHLPFMAKLVSLLVTQQTDFDCVSYQPGTLVCLGQADNPHWSVEWMITPELLRSTA